MALEDHLDLANPENHCNQDHDHFACPWPAWDAGDWEGQLRWSMGDHGFNEGADQAAALLAEYGYGLPSGVADIVGQAIGNLWDRCNMMHFAVDLAKSGNVEPAVGLALLSQWHNCHAFKCLICHIPEIGIWLTQQ